MRKFFTSWSLRNTLLFACILSGISCTTMHRQKAGTASGGKGAYETQNYRNLLDKVRLIA
jgi:hypothetical protein